MKRPKFSESQSVSILKEAEYGVLVEDLSCQHGFSKASFYRWRGMSGGMSVSEQERCGRVTRQRLDDPAVAGSQKKHGQKNGKYAFHFLCPTFNCIPLGLLRIAQELENRRRC